MPEDGVGWAEARELAHRLGSRSLTEAVELRLDEAMGRTLARDLRSPISLPQRPTSAMDGWAVAGDAPWRIDAGALAGDAPVTEAMPPGTARPTATGAMVPPGAHRVIRTENGSIVRSDQGTAGQWLWPRGDGADLPARRGADLRAEGEEVLAAETVLTAGLVLTPARAALAAITGVDRVWVRTAPRVQTVISGAEVRRSGIPEPGAVRDAFGPSLPAMLRHWGADALPPTFVGDDRSLIAAMIASATAPLLVVTGGTSRGPADFLRGALADCAASVRVDGVRMRPGHPVLIATVAGRTVLGLPGNPLAALAVLVSFGGPLIGGMLGRPLPGFSQVTAGAELVNTGRDTRIVAVRHEGIGVVPVPWQGSGMVRGIAQADCLVVVPSGGVAAGGVLDVLPLPW